MAGSGEAGAARGRGRPGRRRVETAAPAGVEAGAATRLWRRGGQRAWWRRGGRRRQGEVGGAAAAAGRGGGCGGGAGRGRGVRRRQLGVWGDSEWMGGNASG